jgi:transposase
MNIVDCETHKILDICVDRKLGYVKRYFEQYPTKIREEVKIVCMDMYQPYISLTKVMFPNAKIVLDRFHILQNVSRALNAYRIELMKRYDKKDGMYKIFKRYGMLLTKSRGKLEMNKARWIPHLQTLKTEEYLLNQMLSTDEKLRNSYWIYQTIKFDGND